MVNFILSIHVILSIFLVVVVLLQPGRGGGFVMGGGGSQTFFGATGAGNFLTKLTTILAILLVITSVVLTKMQLSDPETSVFDVATPSMDVKKAVPENKGKKDMATDGAEQKQAPKSKTE